MADPNQVQTATARDQPVINVRHIGSRKLRAGRPVVAIEHALIQIPRFAEPLRPNHMDAPFRVLGDGGAEDVAFVGGQAHRIATFAANVNMIAAISIRLPGTPYFSAAGYGDRRKVVLLRIFRRDAQDRGNPRDMYVAIEEPELAAIQEIGKTNGETALGGLEIYR